MVMATSSVPVCTQAGWYSLLGFLRGREKEVADLFLRELNDAVATGRSVRYEHAGARVWTSFLPWDSDFFGVPIYRVDFVQCDALPGAAPSVIASILAQVMQVMQDRHGKYYLFGEVPSEDVATMQAMGLQRMRLIETRLTYYRDDVEQFAWQRRSPIRHATEADIGGLYETAATMRNTFDRFHADPCFSSALADSLVGTFAEKSVKGLADIVLVPAAGDDIPDAFLTAKLLPVESDFLGCRLGRMVLSAASERRRGWYLRLVAEMSYWMKEQGVEVAFMTTQSTNRAVIRVWEKLGYRYGRCSHIFAAPCDVSR